MTKVTLHGQLGERFGREYNMAVSSFGEALHAINVKNKKQFYPWLYEKDKTGIKYRIIINGQDFQSDVPLDNLSKESVEAALVSDLTIKRTIETIDIVPVIEGADSDTMGIITLVLGVLLIATGIGAGLGVGFLSFASGYAGTIALVGIALVAGGIISLLSQPPEFQDFRDISNSGKTSYLFSGPQNTVGEGGPVPIGYGAMIVGSQTIAASYRIKNVDASATIGPEDALNALIDVDVYNMANRTDISVTGPVRALAFSDDGMLRYTSSFSTRENPIAGQPTQGTTVFTLNQNLENILTTVYPIAYFPIVNDLSNDGVIVGNGSITQQHGRKLIQYLGIILPLSIFAFNQTNSISIGFWGDAGNVYCISRYDATWYVVGGSFSRFRYESGLSETTLGVAKLTLNGVIDTTFASNASVSGGSVYCIAIQSDNKILIGGDFTTVNGIARDKVARLNSDGTLDTSYVSTVGSMGTGIVYSIKQLSNGKILLGGTFAKCNNDTNYAYFCRVDANGGPDAYIGGFSANPTIKSIAVQSIDNKIIIGGQFTAVNNVGKICLARLNSDFTIDDTLDTGSIFKNNIVNVVKVRDDFNQAGANGKIYIGTESTVNVQNKPSYGSLIILNNDGYIS